MTKSNLERKRVVWFVYPETQSTEGGQGRNSIQIGT